MNFRHILISIFFVLFCSQLSFGQSSAQLKKQLEKINSEIANLNKELLAKTKEKLLSQKEVTALSRQITLREEKISVIRIQNLLMSLRRN
jgi:predicted  nucleic acid-binding Zn-ribbon protein